MSYLLDTCILSRSIKNHADTEKLKHWLDAHPETSYFMSVISIGEIQAGISKLKPEERKKKDTFEQWLLGDLIPRFEDRIISVDTQTCLIWGKLQGEARKRGRPLAAIDSLIAALALQHQLIVVTENTKDFIATGVPLLNPLEK